MLFKKLPIILCIFFCYAFAKAQQETPQYKRVKVFLNQTKTLAQLNQTGVAADHGIHKDGTFIISDFSLQELEKIRNAGFQFETIEEDIQNTYKEQSTRSTIASRNVACSSSDAVAYETPANFNLGSMGGYLTYQELLDELDDMAGQYPDLITARAPISNFLTEGFTDDGVTPSIGGNPIYWLKISDNPENDETEPEVLYTSIHHAREPMSLMQLVYYMWYLLENYDTNDEVRAIVNNTELYFIPVINPDGYLYNELTDPEGGGLWRKNRKNGHGVDNNRNYDYHIHGNPNDGSWGGPGSSSNTNNETYHGSGPFSEVETQAVKWFVEQHDFVIALNNHSFGELVYYPFGYADVDTPDDDLFQGIGGALTSMNGYNALNDFPFAGDSDDFMYGTVGTHDKIFAFTPEIGNSFWPPASTIISTSQNMMFLNLTAAQIAVNYGVLTETSPSFIGESTTLSTSFDVKRFSVESTGDFTITFSPISSNIIDQGAPVTLSNLTPLETQSGSIAYSLSTNVEVGDAIEFNLIIDNGLFEKEVRVSKIYGSTTQIFYTDGNSLADFESTSWGTTSASFVSPSSSITDSPSGNYSDNTNNFIELTQSLDLTEATTATVSYYARWNIEDTWDYVQFEISKDNGATWESQCGNFTTTGTNIQPLGEPLYDGVQDDWILEEINLSDYIGETIKARFSLRTDGAVTRDGFYVDDLSFSIISGEQLHVDSEQFSKAFEIFPNPVSNQLNIRTSLGSYTTSVYNILGQKMTSAVRQSGNSTVDYGALPTGMYFLKVENTKKSTIFKIVKK
ncbi:M14 family zinc carboxypeptidase [uncultured Dokdonia sp.]|uniref:M14 family zinc carboxypeptidase n=1 Tax=uncultured Dokdonia sp. TaxID=575653 RepID=UPI0030EB8341|tara:strand:- start:85432 stop:87819 length:2388 start_codon:yes stop_codon:yes gene_type:complete